MTLSNKYLIKQLLKQELARRDFWEFCLYMNSDFFVNRLFLKDIADGFQDIEERKIKSLAVMMPPRAGKSYITSLFCAWTLGRNPQQSVMRNSCTATLYLKFSYDVRAIVKSELFRQVFPTVVLSDDKANLQGWNTNNSVMVGYFGAGVGGTIIGFGASNVAITDDLYKGMEDALSDTQNDRILQWKEATHDSRFETGCARIDIGTRWSINDMIGKNVKNGIYEKTILVPAMTPENKSFCEYVLTTEEYLDKKNRTEHSIWMAEYMQSPIDIQGRLFDSLQFVDNVNVEKLEGTIAYVDVADQGNDYTACAILGVIDNEFYIIDYVFNKANTDYTLPQIAQKLEKWDVKYCRVESNSMGAMFARQLSRMVKTNILQVANSTNKNTRIIMNSAWIQNRINFKKPYDNESEQFVQNILSYSKEGKNKNDDAPDCLAGLSIFAQSMFRHIS